ncbi:MAG TPA: SRPBCC family protein [Gemmatimonadaceae bacterium]|jgi:uncharacterized membrane protein|nr:SRPBCC family protein [Gemmatimonadaceae bacterium]
MSHVARSVTVSSDPKRIIDYIANVGNHPAFLGALKSVTNLAGDSRTPGASWDWTFMMGGVEFTGRAETVAYEPGKKYSFKTTSGIASTFVYSCEPAGGQTKLTIDVTYEVPRTLLAKMQTAVVEKLNEAEGASAVENLKAILDT